MAESIRDLLLSIIKGEADSLGFAHAPIICTVKEVSNNIAILSPVNDGAEINEVRAYASSEVAQGLVLTPKIGSIVIAVMLNKNEAFIAHFTEVETINLRGDQFGGLVKADELKTQIDKNTEILNQIQTAFNSWVTIGGDGGAALKALSSSFTGLNRADLSNIKNDNVKHG